MLNAGHPVHFDILLCTYVLCRKKGEYSEEDGESVDSDFPAYCVRSSPKQSEQQSSSDDCVLLEESVTRSKVCGTLIHMYSAKSYILVGVLM